MVEMAEYTFEISGVDWIGQQVRHAAPPPLASLREGRDAGLPVAMQVGVAESPTGLRIPHCHTGSCC